MNNMQIQKNRDKKIVEFLDHFQAATTDTLHELFFIKQNGKHTTYRMASKRLARLVETKQIKKDRENVTQQYFYYLSGNKPTSQLKHTLLITDFYRELHKLQDVKIYRYFRITLGDVRPDAFMVFTINNKEVVACLEVEISNKGFDMDKYSLYKQKRLYESMGMKEMPKLIIVSNRRNIPDAHGIEIIKIRTDLSDIHKISRL